jgi:hypothetical protein
MSISTPELENLITTSLRAAGGPLREVVLYDRVTRGRADITPEQFLGTLGRLATLGHLGMSVEHNRPVVDIDPFQPRFWRVID